MKTCQNDTRVTETMYPSSDYVEEQDVYGTRVFKTLKPNHSSGVSVIRVVLCDKCKLEKARPRSTEDKLRTLQRQEDIPSQADWTNTQKGLSRKLGLSGKAFNAVCSKCGNADKVRDADGRGPLCEKCYKAFRAEYKRNYMRDFMRQKRESIHVD